MLVSFAVGWWLHRSQPESAPWKLTQLTSDAGLSGFPALSPDRKLVAYSADHGLDGGRDLYVKQVAGGQPIRLTFDGEGNTTPDFSPDGSKITSMYSATLKGIASDYATCAGTPHQKGALQACRILPIRA
jgi:Tol biopolymer transport system component